MNTCPPTIGKGKINLPSLSIAKWQGFLFLEEVRLESAKVAAEWFGYIINGSEKEPKHEGGLDNGRRNSEVV
jgi:hypothetical protein